MDADVEAEVARAFRDEWGRVVATLIRVTGDWDLAEDCAQDAFAQALRRWPDDGVPRRPGAWLTTVARNRALDRLRRGSTEAAKLREAAVLQLMPSPVVELNRAAAVAMADGPAAGLKLVEALESSPALQGYYLLPATRADLLRRLGRHAEAAVSYRAALGLAPSATERRYLARRLAETQGQA